MSEQNHDDDHDPEPRGVLGRHQADPCVLVNRKLEILASSDAFERHYALPSHAGPHTVMDVLPPLTWKGCSPMLQEAFCDYACDALVDEVTETRPEKVRLWVTATPVPSHDGTVEYVVLTLRDTASVFPIDYPQR